MTAANVDPRSGLVLDSVNAGYGARRVLHGVSLVAPAGRVTGLIGPNGSGKTTVVRVASRGLRPDSGAVRAGGIDPYAVDARTAARTVAVVPQAMSSAFAYSAYELVAMGRSPHVTGFRSGTPADWERIRWALRAASIEHLSDRSFEELSGGERQRVVVAQALAQDAPVLLLDEPTAHLDVHHVVDILRVVGRLARRDGRAVLAIFHDLNLASAFCDTIHAMSNGRVVASGTPSEVITGRLLREVFGVDADVHPSPTSGRPVVAVVAPGDEEAAPVDLHAAARAVMQSRADARFR